MSGRKAKEQRRQHRSQPGRIPRRPDRVAIADAVHEAVCLISGSDGYGHCIFYAQVGAVVASAVTGRKFSMQAGQLWIGLGDVDGTGQELFLAAIPDGGEYHHEGIGATVSGGLEVGEFHAWFAREPDGVSPEPGTAVTVSPHDYECADLSLRHHQRFVADAGMEYHRPPLPPFFWGSPLQLAELGVRVKADTDTVNFALSQVQQHQQVVMDMAAVTMLILGRANENRAQQVMSPDGYARWRMRADGWQVAEVIPGGGTLLIR
jgi:hypothetical protein